MRGFILQLRKFLDHAVRIFYRIDLGDTVAIWGAGPVGQMSIRSAFLLGAERVLTIDHFPSRLRMAKQAGAESVHFDEVDGILDEIKYLTDGNEPDSCIDAVGLETHGRSFTATLDRAKAATFLATDRPEDLTANSQ